MRPLAGIVTERVARATRYRTAEPIKMIGKAWAGLRGRRHPQKMCGMLSIWKSTMKMDRLVTLPRGGAKCGQTHPDRP